MSWILVKINYILLVIKRKDFYLQFYFKNEKYADSFHVI